MNKAYPGIMLLFLIGCTSAKASAINPSDDLHCAVLIRTLKKNADQLGATPTATKGLYVLQTWYFAKVKPERLEEAQDVLEAMKENPTEVPPAGQICSNRAFSDPGFSRWRTIASADYDQKATR
jgi:hypothetical protein